jgi:uroporphyrinogen-III decarboxylase
MNSLERVRRAVHMQGPDRVPVIMVNRDFERSDIIKNDVVLHFQGEGQNLSEFGFRWDRLDGTMGQPTGPTIADLEAQDDFPFPDPRNPRRFDEALEFMKKYPGKYYVASLCLSGFTVMTFLRGFEETLIDLYEEPALIGRLADRVFGFEEEIIRQAASKGFHAIGFFDDWGTQDRLIISPDKWREFFKIRYKHQFDLCHELGMDVYFHCCGYITDIIEDLVEIGVDILNLSQPNLFDIKEIGRKFGGKTCFLCPISYQTTSLSGTKDEIYAAAKEMIVSFGSFDGGFIGYVEEYASLGLSEENYWSCLGAFLEQGVYEGNV